MSNLYKARGKADQNFMQGGYKNVVLWAPIDTFTNVAHPTVFTLAGEKLTITDDHTFGVDDGFISWLCKLHSVTIKTETTGDPGAQSLVHTCEFILLGDDASTLDQLRDLLNDNCMFLVKDQDCLTANQYVQLGDDCLAPEINVSFDGKTTKEGLKEYTVKLSVKDKRFYYEGTVTEKP